MVVVDIYLLLDVCSYGILLIRLLLGETVIIRKTWKKKKRKENRKGRKKNGGKTFLFLYTDRLVVCDKKTKNRRKQQE